MQGICGHKNKKNVCVSLWWRRKFPHKSDSTHKKTYFCKKNIMRTFSPVLKRAAIRGLLGVVLIASAATASSQTLPVFKSPLDIPLFLSGTFAELRSNHFHSGIDFKTQGVEGMAVHAVADGYVSRIKIESGGYGQALYITHPNGYTSVCAHLSRYSDALTAYIRAQQYAQENFAVDLFPPADMFPVKEGEVVAWSGNTGSSMGPHMHFEIRDTKTENTANALRFGFELADHIPPVIKQLAVYAMQDDGEVDGAAVQYYNAVQSGRTFTLPGNRTPVVRGDFAVGIETIDMMDETPNQDGPYTLKLFVDSVLYYRFVADEFSFDDTRAINSLIDYPAYIDTKDQIYKMVVSPYNCLTMIKEHRNNGVISFSEPGMHKIRIEVADIAGNRSVAQFSVRHEPIWTPPISAQVARLLQPVKFRQAQHIVEEGITIDIPPYALYDECDIRCTVMPPMPGMLAPTYHIHDTHTPLHKRMTLRMRADSIPEELQSKALVVNINNTGRAVSAGGKYENGFMTADVFAFGAYTIGIDTVPPAIRPVRAAAPKADGLENFGKEGISLRISDDFAGIQSFRGTIDGQWVLFAFDAKNARVLYRWDDHCPATGKEHQLRFEVTDGTGNVSVYEARFIR